jgi:hypothetical protein
MNRERFVFRIGPVPAGEREANAYFVMPATTGTSVYLAEDNSSGLAQIVRDHDAASLECEPELAAAGREFGIPAGEINRQRAHWIGGSAMDLALGEPFRPISREESVYAFAVAASAFWRAAPWQYESLRGAIDVSLRGSLNDRLAAVVLGGGNVYGLSLYQGINSVRLQAELARSGRLEEAARSNSLILTFSAEPAFAVDAMRRAYDMPRVPITTKMMNGEGTPLSDLDLMAIGATAKAVSILTDEIAAACGEIMAADLKLEATVHPIERPAGGF